MSVIEIRRGGETICVCKDESCLYPADIMKRMKAVGYKFYQDGKLWKPQGK